MGYLQSRFSRLLVSAFLVGTFLVAPVDRTNAGKKSECSKGRHPDISVDYDAQRIKGTFTLRVECVEHGPWFPVWTRGFSVQTRAERNGNLEGSSIKRCTGKKFCRISVRIPHPPAERASYRFLAIYTDWDGKMREDWTRPYVCISAVVLHDCDI